MNEEVINDVDVLDPYGFIYITTNNINGKKYIGQRKFYDNWKNYLGSGNLLLKAIKKYGSNNFSRNIIAIGYSKDELNELEIEFIKLHNAVKSDNYYNISYGGGTNNGIHWSDETKMKMSEVKKGKNNARYGTHHSKESIEKMSNARKGERNQNYGKSPSKETREKIRQANLGRIYTKEQLKNMSESHIKVNDEQAEEIREKYATKKYSQSKLAKEYSVAQSTINNIINFKNTYKQ